MTALLSPGLYQVTTNLFVAAFYVDEAKKVTHCAPILRKHLYNIWVKKAVRVIPPVVDDSSNNLLQLLGANP